MILRGDARVAQFAEKWRKSRPQAVEGGGARVFPVHVQPPLMDGADALDRQPGQIAGRNIETRAPYPLKPVPVMISMTIE